MLIVTPDEKREVTWDSRDSASVARVKEEFDRLIEHNFAFETTTEGKKEQIHKFDPEAESITVTVPLVGG